MYYKLGAKVLQILRQTGMVRMKMSYKKIVDLIDGYAILVQQPQYL